MRRVVPDSLGLPRRACELATNVRLTVVTVAQHLADDPLLLLIQGSRRLPPTVVSTAARLLLLLSRVGRHPGVLAAYGCWLGGRPDAAADALGVASARRPTTTSSVRGRLLAELAVQLGRPELAISALHARPRSLMVRSAWLRGDVTAAISPPAAGDPPTPLAARLASEARLLAPGRRLDPPSARRCRTDPGAHGRTGSPCTLPPALAAEEVAVLHILTNSLPHTRSGYALRSHAVLRAQRKAGIRAAATTRLAYPVSIGVAGARHLDVVDGVPYHRLIPARMARTAEARAAQQVDLLLPLVEDLAPDLLHTTTNFLNAMITQAVARALGVPWVYEVRGLLEETWIAGFPRGDEQARAARSERYALLRAKETEMARAADGVVTLGTTLRDELVGRGVDASTIAVVPNAVDAELLRASTDASDARRAVGLPSAGFWVGTVSSLVDYEGLDTLIDAVSELRSRGVDARALVVGDGVSRTKLEQRAAAAGLGGHAVFTGRVDRSKAPLYHQALDVFVVPRRDLRVSRQVTPLKPTEAMAVGRPVVASDLPALAELVQPHGSGRLVPPDDASALADALEELHASPDLRATYAAAGRAFAAQRTWDGAAATYRSLYANLCRTGPR